MSSSGCFEQMDYVPNPRKAVQVAQHFLHGKRLRHVTRAGQVAVDVPLRLTPRDRGLLVAAATLHDIGYSEAIRDTGFHPLDAGRYLRDQGFSPRLASLVANHSHAWLHCPDPWLGELAVEFPRERSLLADAVLYADMHAAPDGSPISLEDRLVDIALRHPAPHLRLRLQMIRESVAHVTARLEVAPTDHCDGPALHPSEPATADAGLRARTRRPKWLAYV